jgi:catalase
VEFRVLVQLAGDAEEVADSTVVWPGAREEVHFGTLTVTVRVDELAQVKRKIIFDPVPRVDGIEPAGDPLTQVCSEIYLLSGRRRRADVARSSVRTGALGDEQRSSRRPPAGRSPAVGRSWKGPR